MNGEIKVLLTHAFCTLFCHTGMQPVVPVIGKEDELGFPFAQILVVHVAYRLVHHLLRLRHGIHRQTTNADIHTPVGVAFTLGVVKETEIVIGRVCLGLYGRVLRLVSKKCVLTAIAAQFAVIVGAVAHKQKPTRFLNTAILVSAVIEHLHHPTISGGIGSSRRELVVGLLVGYNRPCYAVYLLMGLR